MVMVVLESSDKDLFEVDTEILKCSGTINNMLQACGQAKGANVKIPLPNVGSMVLDKILIWAKYHADNDKKIDEDSTNISNDVENWEKEFLKVDVNLLFKLIMAANYLDIEDLFRLSCKAVADTINGRSIFEIREIFQIKSN